MLLNRNGIQESICIPPICLDSQSAEKSRGGESAFSNDSNFNLADPKLESRTLTPFCEKSNHFATKNNFRKGPQNQQHPLIQNGLSKEAFVRGTAEDLGGRSGGLVPP